MPKDTKTLGNNKARACESLGFAHKKGCANILTQPLLYIPQIVLLHLEEIRRRHLPSLILGTDGITRILPRK